MVVAVILTENREAVVRASARAHPDGSPASPSLIRDHTPAGVGVNQPSVVGKLPAFRMLSLSFLMVTHTGSL